LRDLDITIIRQLCATHKIEWTIHVSKRLLQRNISALEEETSIGNGVINEMLVMQRNIGR